MGKKRRKRLSGVRLDKYRCSIAYRQIGTLSMDLIDWIEDLRRYRRSDLAIDHHELLLESLLESKKAVKALIKELR